MNFGKALEALKNGQLVTRAGWNGKGMFLFSRCADTFDIEVVLGMKSLPKSVKDYYERKHQPIHPADNIQITFTAFLCMKAADDTIVNGWLASQTDMQAEDWQIFEYN
ncbi:MAG: DUF2829 domain-containing protein [Candidatus Kapaibacterium sp.]